MPFVTATATLMTVADLGDGDLFRFSADGSTFRAHRVTRHEPGVWFGGMENYTVDYSGRDRDALSYVVGGLWIGVPTDAPVWLVHRPGDSAPVVLAKERYARPVVPGDLVVIPTCDPFDLFQGRPMHVTEITDWGYGPHLRLAFSAAGTTVACVRPAGVVLVRA